jgi:UDP-glucose 4-epimerase
VLVLSEVVDLLGKTNLPVLPPWGTGLAIEGLHRAGLPVTRELCPQLRFGRGLDNRRFKATGFRYRYTTRETILRLREQQRLAPIVGRQSGSSYRYESAVEEFLRFSPSVRQANARPALPPENTAPGVRRGGGYDGLTAKEILALLPSLERADLERLRDHEAAHAKRQSVLRGIERLLERQETSVH